MACGDFLERAAGIEPASLAWKAKVLPLQNGRRFQQLNARETSSILNGSDTLSRADSYQNGRCVNRCVIALTVT